MKIKDLNTYNNNNTINYKKYIINIQYTLNQNINLIKKYINNYDNLCKKIILYKRLDINKNINYEKLNLSKIRYLDNRIYYNNILKNLIKSKHNLIITNTFPIINQLNDLKIKLNGQLFENEEMPIIRFEEDLNKIKRLKNIENIENSTIQQYLSNVSVNKYDSMICKINEFEYPSYLNIFTLTKIPNILFVVVQALRQLNKNGDLYLFFRIGIMNPTYQKLINLLTNSFKKVEIIHNNQDKNDSNVVLHCQGFKDNITKPTMNKLVDMCLKSRKYNYTLCQFMHYFYYISKTQPDKPLLYPFNYQDIGDVKASEIKQKTMNILDDIDINPKKSREGDFLIYQMEKLYEEYFDNAHYNILRYIKEDDKGKIQVDKEFFDKILYDKLVSMVRIFDENKIPYNKAYLAYINKYDENIMNSLYTYRDIIKFKLVKYSSVIKSKSISSSSKKRSRKRSQKKSSKKNSKKNSKGNQIELLDKIGKHKSFHYSEADEIQELSNVVYKMRIRTFSDYDEQEYKKKFKSVKRVTEGFTRGVSQYINQVFRIPISLSNAFMKLWEIFCSIPQLIPNRGNVSVFHLAEAPGQWINCAKHFVKKRRPKVANYNWIANSLNHKHPTNIKKYGKGAVFGDQYGFIKKYPERWLYGADNTGDITKSKNVLWFKEYLQQWREDNNTKINLVTGDAGIAKDSLDLLDLQKLEYGQMAMVAASSNKGSNCVIKHWLPYMNTIENSSKATGYFVSLIYCYYLMFQEVILMKPHTSNPNSGEFYLVGLKFIGAPDKYINKIVKQLDQFEENYCCFKEEDIPESFSKQVLEFNKSMLKLISEQHEIQNILMTCIAHKDPVIEKVTKCKHYLSDKFIKEIQTKRYKEWIKQNRFE